MKNKIVVIGSSNVDLIMKMDRLPEKGETITDAGFFQVYGGKGANQAVGAVRVGGNVAFVNCVGDDAYTPQMLENFRNDGLDIRFVFQEIGIASGHALVMIGGEGNNYLSVAPGANYKLTPDKIDLAMPVIDEAAMIIMQYEIPAETIKYVFEIAEMKNIPVLWNFAPARSFDLLYVAKTSILVVNETEAAFLSGMEVETYEEVELAAQKLRELGAKLVIITLGKRGSFALSATEKVSVSAFKVDAVDTTSAGDVFCGSFAVAQIEGKSLTDSLRFASAASAICVTRIGAQPSAPMRKEIDDFLLLFEKNRLTLKTSVSLESHLKNKMTIHKFN
jgi:ribokinase